MSPPGKGSELTGLTLLNFGILDSLPQLGTASARAGAGAPYPLNKNPLTLVQSGVELWDAQTQLNGNI